MKKTIIIEIELNETGQVEDMAITEGAYARTEYLMAGVDEPVSIGMAASMIEQDLSERTGC